MAYRLIGKDFLPPDVVAKVTGRAKYAEDFRVDGMLHLQLLTSPLPHARVNSHRCRHRRSGCRAWWRC